MKNKIYPDIVVENIFGLVIHVEGKRLKPRDRKCVTHPATSQEINNLIKYGYLKECD